MRDTDGEPPNGTDTGERLTHVDAEGRPAMVDVGDKAATERTALAEGRIVVSKRAFELLLEGGGRKGDPLTVARIAGIQAAKRTAELIPLCHPLQLDHVEVELVPDPDLPGVRVTGKVRLVGRTGVEMEALTAVSVALLTVYDMLKATDRGMRIDGVRLLEKSGGRSGHWAAEDSSAPGT